MAGALPSDTVMNPKLNVNSTSLVLSACSYQTEDPQCSTYIHGLINTITIHQSNPHDDMPEEDERKGEGNPKDTNTVERNTTTEAKRPNCYYLSHVVFGRPFVEVASLAINKKHDLMTFTDGIKEVTFKTPHNDNERSDLSSEGHDLLSSRIILSEDDYDRGYRKPSDLEDGFYRDTIKLGPGYCDWNG
ncbi:hypothetical protein Tco_0561165 [Tanacetum coccineum]